MNVKCNLIEELYEIELGYDTAEATKNICCTKSEGVVDPNRVNSRYRKFH